MTDDGAHTPGQPENATQAKPGILPRVKNALVSTEKEFAFIKGLSFIGFLGTLLVAYFQYLSAYQERVSAQAKEDLAAATSVFTEASHAFSTAMTLQQILFFDFRDAIRANADSNENAMPTKNAREIYAKYDAERTAMRQNTDILARKVEIYIDWASNLDRDPAKPSQIGVDPMDGSSLGAYDFDCDRDMPNFSSDKPTFIHLKKEQNKPPILRIDWYSAKHHILTMQYCFDLTHRSLLVARAWGSKSVVAPSDRDKFGNAENIAKMQDKLDQAVMRLNAFMSLAMRRIENIRVKYRPSGWYCHVPVVREVIGLFGRSCEPLQLASN